MKRFRSILVCICILLTSCASSSAQLEPSASALMLQRGTLLCLTDIHFNPFADTAIVPELIQASPEKWAEIFERSTDIHLSKYGEETNYRLLVSALERMYFTCPFPDLIVFSGDLLAHNFRTDFAKFAQEGYENFVAKTLRFIGWELGQYFPSTQVFFTLGNNDAYDDYLIAPNDNFLRNTADIYFHGYLKAAQKHKAAFNATFLQGGQYTLRAQAPGHPRMIVINNIFFSGHNPYPDVGWSQLHWLQSQLEKARKTGERVWIITHIPPGVDVWSTLMQPGTISHYWNAQNLNLRNQTLLVRFMELCQAFSREIAGIFCGHTHMDHFRLVWNEKDFPAAFVHISPALSPQFGNNPAFQVLCYDARSLDLLDVITYYSNGPSWEPEYSFAKAYAQSGYRLPNLQEAFHEIYRDGDARQKFADYYDVSNPADAPITDSNWQAYWCGITALTDPAFESCTVPGQ